MDRAARTKELMWNDYLGDSNRQWQITSCGIIVIEMTLVVALKYKDGVILASDSRVMYGPIKRDQARKLEPLTENIGAAAAGLLGAIDDVLRSVKELCTSRPVSFDDVVSYLSDVNYKWYEENSKKLSEDESGPTFIVVSPERIRRVFEKGYSEEAYDYACEGSGRQYGEYILQNFYIEAVGEKEAKELAVYTISETSKMDPTVGEDISMLVFKKEKCQAVTKEEIEGIKGSLAPFTRKASEAQSKKIESIVNLREQINNLSQKRFGFALFSPHEKALFQIMKPCRHEEEFTNNIAALALLIDRINLQEMKKTTEKKEGSINVLEEFMAREIGEFPQQIAANLRNIMILRSEKFPIHVTNQKFVEACLRLVGKYPPSWTDLWLKAMEQYEEALEKLLECLQKKTKE